MGEARRPARCRRRTNAPRARSDRQRGRTPGRAARPRHAARPCGPAATAGSCRRHRYRRREYGSAARAGPSARATARNCSRWSARRPRPGRSLLRGRTAPATSFTLVAAGGAVAANEGRAASVSYHWQSPACPERQSRCGLRASMPSAQASVSCAMFSAPGMYGCSISRSQRSTMRAARSVSCRITPGERSFGGPVQLAQPYREPVHQASRQRLQPARFPSRFARGQRQRPACRRACRSNRK